MSDEGEARAIFMSYLLVARHTGDALMREIYETTFLRKLRLSPAAITELCSGAALYRHYLFVKTVLEFLPTGLKNKRMEVKPQELKFQTIWSG
jgi:hypothetical protein